MALATESPAKLARERRIVQEREQNYHDKLVEKDDKIHELQQFNSKLSREKANLAKSNKEQTDQAVAWSQEVSRLQVELQDARNRPNQRHELLALATDKKNLENERNGLIEHNESLRDEIDARDGAANQAQTDLASLRAQLEGATAQITNLQEQATSSSNAHMSDMGRMKQDYEGQIMAIKNMTFDSRMLQLDEELKSKEAEHREALNRLEMDRSADESRIAELEQQLARNATTDPQQIMQASGGGPNGTATIAHSDQAPRERDQQEIAKLRATNAKLKANNKKLMTEGDQRLADMQKSVEATKEAVEAERKEIRRFTGGLPLDEFMDRRGAKEAGVPLEEFGDRKAAREAGISLNVFRARKAAIEDEAAALAAQPNGSTSAGDPQAEAILRATRERAAVEIVTLKHQLDGLLRGRTPEEFHKSVGDMQAEILRVQNENWTMQSDMSPIKRLMNNLTPEQFVAEVSRQADVMANFRAYFNDLAPEQAMSKVTEMQNDLSVIKQVLGDRNLEDVVADASRKADELARIGKALSGRNVEEVVTQAKSHKEELRSAKNIIKERDQTIARMIDSTADAKPHKEVIGDRSLGEVLAEWKAQDQEIEKLQDTIGEQERSLFDFQEQQEEIARHKDILGDRPFGAVLAEWKTQRDNNLWDEINARNQKIIELEEKLKKTKQTETQTNGQPTEEILAELNARQNRIIDAQKIIEGQKQTITSMTDQQNEILQVRNTIAEQQQTIASMSNQQNEMVQAKNTIAEQHQTIAQMTDHQAEITQIKMQFGDRPVNEIIDHITRQQGELTQIKAQCGDQTVNEIIDHITQRQKEFAYIDGLVGDLTTEQSDTLTTDLPEKLRLLKSQLQNLTIEHFTKEAKVFNEQVAKLDAIAGGLTWEGLIKQSTEYMTAAELRPLQRENSVSSLDRKRSRSPVKRNGGKSLSDELGDLDPNNEDEAGEGLRIETIERQPVQQLSFSSIITPFDLPPVDAVVPAAAPRPLMVDGNTQTTSAWKPSEPVSLDFSFMGAVQETKPAAPSKVSNKAATTAPTTKDDSTIRNGPKPLSTFSTTLPRYSIRTKAERERRAAADKARREFYSDDEEVEIDPVEPKMIKIEPLETSIVKADSIEAGSSKAESFTTGSRMIKDIGAEQINRYHSREPFIKANVVKSNTNYWDTIKPSMKPNDRKTDMVKPKTFEAKTDSSKIATVEPNSAGIDANKVESIKAEPISPVPQPATLTLPETAPTFAELLSEMPWYIYFFLFSMLVLWLCGCLHNVYLEHLWLAANDYTRQHVIFLQHGGESTWLKSLFDVLGSELASPRHFGG